MGQLEKRPGDRTLFLKRDMEGRRGNLNQLIFAVKEGASLCYCACVLRIKIRVSQGQCKVIQRYFGAVYDYAGKADLSKGY